MLAYAKTAGLFRPFHKLSKKASQNLPPKRQTHLNHFWPRRVRGQKYISDCKCASCAPKTTGPPSSKLCFMGRGDAQILVEFSACRKCNSVSDASTKCAQQAEKSCRKSPKGFFDKLKNGRIIPAVSEAPAPCGIKIPRWRGVWCDLGNTASRPAGHPVSRPAPMHCA